MAQSPKEVFDLINTLKDKALNQSIKETELINDFGKSIGIENVQLWDFSYLSEKIKLRDYQFDEVEFKKYLPINNCLKGLFWFLKEMFNVDIKYVDTPHTYHKDLQLLELSKNGEIISYIYMDLYSRKGKKSGAWMNNIVDKSLTQLPIAVVVCNFAAPTDETPCLLTFDHLETLFHEFGHATHHALSTVPYPYATGVNNVPWDAIEVPSTLMEFFCINDSVLNQITEHYETGETLPSELKESLVKSKNFLFSRFLMRQLEFTIADMKLHMEDVTDVHDYLNELRESLGTQKIPENCKPLNNFRHIFAGGYAAGYYSYKWSDILSADIFKTFSDNGVLCKDTAKKYLDEYLSQGGSKDPNELFFNFKGRKPTPDAFLELNGI
jgi:oligopeptidase A